MMMMMFSCTYQYCACVTYQFAKANVTLDFILGYKIFYKTWYA